MNSTKHSVNLWEKILRAVCWCASLMFYGNGLNGDWIYEKMQRPSSYLNGALNVLYYTLKRPRIHCPVSIIIEPVFGCNLHCSYCWNSINRYFEYKAKRPHLMPVELFRKAVDQTPDTVESIAFGLIGEPLLHPRIVEMIQYAHDKGFRTVLYTNGTLLKGDVADLIAESPLDVLSVSVEPDETNSRKHRGVNPAVTRKTLEAFAEKKHKATEIKLSVVVHNDNMGLITGLQTEWQSLIRHIKLSPVIRYNGTTPPKNCIEPWRGSFCILTDGEVSPCCISAGYRPVSVGNLNDNDLMNIVSGRKFRAFLKECSDGCFPGVCIRCNEFSTKNIPGRIPGNHRQVRLI